MQRVLAVLLAAALLGPAQPTAAGEINIIIAGQSNASGRGQEPLTYANLDRVRVMGRDGQWRPAQDPLHDDANAAVGPGLSIADRLAEVFPNDTIGLIPCAVGNTGIRLHRPSWDRSTIYGACVARAAAAGSVAGVFFWQGENDALKLPLARAWLGEFQRLVTQLRLDLGDLRLPWVVARLQAKPSPSFPVPGWSTVRVAQGALRVPRLSVVSTDGIFYYPRTVHADSAGLRTVGYRAADALVAMLKAPDETLTAR